MRTDEVSARIFRGRVITNTKLSWHYLALGTLLAISLIVNLWGIGWGLPGFWHPDEKLLQIRNMLERGTLSAPRFNHPTLPIYCMLAATKLSILLGGAASAQLVSRIVSAMLGTATVGLTYLIMRTVCRRDGMATLLAPLLVIASSGFVVIAHYASVDIYLTFFVTLTIWLLLRYVSTGHRTQFLLATVALGLAVSSKYNAAILVIPVAITILFIRRQETLFRSFKVLSIGIMLAGVAFLTGTPSALIETGRFARQVLEVFSIQHHYGGVRPIGLLGQKESFVKALGKPLSIVFLFGATLAGASSLLKLLVSTDLSNRHIPPLAQRIQLSLRHFAQKAWPRLEDGQTLSHARSTLVIILVLIAFDFPISLTTYYPMRFIIPMIPGLAVLTALVVVEMWQMSNHHRGRVFRASIIMVLVSVATYSYLRVVGIGLLFTNDSRVTASQWLTNGLPTGSSIEYTSLGPNFPSERYVLHRYPFTIRRRPNTPLPPSNTGLAGVEKRRPDHLVVTSLTYDWYVQNEMLCELNLANCVFFRGLMAGETAYTMSAHFHYRLPEWMPETHTTFVNPDVYLFTRTEEDYPAEKALSLLERHAYAISSDPPPDLWINLGRVYDEQGREAEATMIFEAVTNLEPHQFPP